MLIPNNNNTMAMSLSTFIGLTSVVLVVGVTLSAVAIALIKEMDAKQRQKQSV